MAFFDCPRGHRVAPETRVFCSTGLTLPIATSPRIERLKIPTATARKTIPRDGNGLLARGAQAACGFR